MKRAVMGLLISGFMGAGVLVPTVVLADPATNPTDSDCHGNRVTSLVQGYGSLKKAADSLGLSVKDLQKQIKETCNAD